MIRPIDVKALDGYRIWIKFSDGAEGELDLCHLVGKGVFKAWDDRRFFENVRITPYEAVTWGEDLDLCPDTFYLELTGRTVEEVERESAQISAHA